MENTEPPPSLTLSASLHKKYHNIFNDQGQGIIHTYANSLKV